MAVVIRAVVIRASPPKNYNRHFNKEKEKRKKLKLYLKCKN